MTEDVKELVQRSLSGDTTAIKQFVERFTGPVYGLCYRLLGHRQDAEDMVQETFVRAVRNLDQWDQQRALEPWLLAIAGNRCRTLMAKRIRRPATVPLTDQVAARPGESQAASQLAEELRMALAKLREEYRQAFVLFHEQELSYAEIGEVLDCPLGTVKTWVHRARREIMDHLRRRGVLQEVRHAVR